MQDSRLEGFNKVMSSPEILYYRHLLRLHPYSTINMHGQASSLFLLYSVQAIYAWRFMYFNILSRVTNMFARMEGAAEK
jgi:hypothetical protein